MSSPATTLSRAPSGFRNLPNKYALFSPRLIFTTLSPKDASLGPYAHPTTAKPMHLFSLDDCMFYTPFKNDHGPLNLAFTFEACVRIYEKMNAKDYKRRALCLYTRPDPESTSNLALISALFNLIVEHSDPWDAYQPISHMELLPFRDAGNGCNEYALGAQDVLYGVWKAGKHGLLRLQEFDSEEYRYYERVENGDLNILGNFVPFASPIDPAYIKAQTPVGNLAPEYSPSQKRMLRGCFDKIKAKFTEENVGMVVRLNEDLYDSTEFQALGMTHIDMYFDDGTNPTDEIVREFIKKADYVIEQQKKKVAVHCKAGLGRTGVLIGAYLIYKYQFTASEAIGYMRVVRPGMVVGPQQRYMQLNQMKWAGWAAVDAAHSLPNEPSNSLPTPPLELSQLDSLLLSDDSRPLTPTRRLAPYADAVGQPRKGPDGRRAVVEASSQDIQIPTTPPRNVKSDAPSPSTEKTSPGGTVRGTKRGPGRSPVAIRAEPVPQPNFAPPVLVRSSSTVSCASSGSELDQRASKRRTGDTSPLSKSGLSSPPPSRDTTPDDDIPPSPLSETASTPPRTASTIATMTPTSPGREFRHRSLIPRRPGTPFTIAPQEGPGPGPNGPGPNGSASDSEVAVAGSPRSKPSSRRMIATPRARPPLYATASQE